MILIYSEKISPRLDYTCHLIFKDILHVGYELTTNSHEFIEAKTPKINYSLKKFGNELYIKANKLLFSGKLDYPDIQPVYYLGEKYFFETSTDSFLPFDPFAASFFIVTRFEEYFEKRKEKYNRYPSQESILYKFNLLDKPVINIWANIISDKIKEIYPHYNFPKKSFKYLTTIDIDNAWAYLHKGVIRSLGAFIKGIFNKNINNIERLKVWFRIQKDPYDTYDYLDGIFQGKEDHILIFFLMGDYSQYDKNLSYKNKYFQKLILWANTKYKVGIHPSFKSSKKEETGRVGMEIKRLESITENKIVRSRQHFLRLSFPDTYRELIKYGIKEDYTMGYSANTGFRAGICTPFFFFDLKKNLATNLKVFPFQVMDVTLRNYLSMNPDAAKIQVEKIMRQVKKVGGTFISIWHNETLNNSGLWKGYRELFEFINVTGTMLEDE